MATSDNMYTNTDNRLFYLSDYVDNSSMGKLCWSLLYLLNEDDKKEKELKEYNREPIKLYINSYGGSVYDMWALVDIMLNSKTPIHTFCNGYAMSAGFLIFLAGHKRFVTKHATLMYHQIYSWGEGKYQDLVESREQMDCLQKTIEGYVIDRTKLTQADLDEIREKKKDYYIDAEMAIRIGIVNEII